MAFHRNELNQAKRTNFDETYNIYIYIYKLKIKWGQTNTVVHVDISHVPNGCFDISRVPNFFPWYDRKKIFKKSFFKNNMGKNHQNHQKKHPALEPEKAGCRSCPTKGCGPVAGPVRDGDLGISPKRIWKLGMHIFSLKMEVPLNYNGCSLNFFLRLECAKHPI